MISQRNLEKMIAILCDEYVVIRCKRYDVYNCSQKLDGDVIMYILQLFAKNADNGEDYNMLDFIRMESDAELEFGWNGDTPTMSIKYGPKETVGYWWPYITLYIGDLYDDIYDWGYFLSLIGKNFNENNEI